MFLRERKPDVSNVVFFGRIKNPASGHNFAKKSICFHQNPDGLESPKRDLDSVVCPYSYLVFSANFSALISFIKFKRFFKHYDTSFDSEVVYFIPCTRTLMVQKF